MANMIQKAKQQVTELVTAAYLAAAEKGELPAGLTLNGSVEIPKDTANGDYAANYAMASAKLMRMPPRKVAETLIANMKLDGSWFESVDVAGPGFMNFRMGSKWYSDVLKNVAEEGDSFCNCNIGEGKKLMVEFVSANPTGPMHMGNARGGVLGDALASVLSRAGYDVWREFYVNDAGNQIVKLGESLTARYFEYFGKEYPLPEGGYHADDIKVIAAQLAEEEGDKWLTADPKERLAYFMDYGNKKELEKIDRDLRTYRVTMQSWMHETFFYENNAKRINDCLQHMADMGLTYEKDGALWLHTSKILSDKLLAEGKKPEDIEKLELKDDVLRRANGFYTYFAADIAYHRNKFEQRGFDKVINVWGADHHGHVARLKGAMDALGLDGEHRLDIVLMQLVKLMRGGEVVRMSKRTGKAISLSDLLDEIPVDAARYFFNSRPESPVEFDLDLAVRQDSENPVYYVQYAHARICTMISALKAEGHEVPDISSVDLSLLTAEQERELIKQIAMLPEEIRLAARDYDPSRINKYVTELAARFHRFYTACRIKGAEEGVLNARLCLADTVRKIIALSLSVIGVSAPSKM